MKQLVPPQSTWNFAHDDLFPAWKHRHVKDQKKREALVAEHEGSMAKELAVARYISLMVTYTRDPHPDGPKELLVVNYESGLFHAHSEIPISDAMRSDLNAVIAHVGGFDLGDDGRVHLMFGSGGVRMVTLEAQAPDVKVNLHLQGSAISDELRGLLHAVAAPAAEAFATYL